MVSVDSSLLVGHPDRLRQHFFLAVVLFAITFVAYAVGVFGVSSGVVFLAMHAALVAVCEAAWVGYRDGGVLVSWVVAYAPFLGFHAEWGFLSLSGRSLAGKLAFFLSPDGLAFLAVEAVVLGTLAFAVGTLVRRGVGALRESAAAG